MLSSGMALRHSCGNLDSSLTRQRTSHHGKQSPRLVDHRLAGREMRFVGHTVGNLGLAPYSTRSEPFPSRLLAMPSAMPPIPLANRTIGEATSLSLGLSPMFIVYFHAVGREPPRHWDRRRLLERPGAAWQKRDVPGNRAGDTDTSEALQTIRLNSIRSIISVWKENTMAPRMLC